MRIIAIALAMSIGALPVLSSAQAAHRAHRHYGKMNIQLADGRTVTFRLVKMGGRMMAVAPVPYLYPGWTGGR